MKYYVCFFTPKTEKKTIRECVIAIEKPSIPIQLKKCINRIIFFSQTRRIKKETRLATKIRKFIEIAHHHALHIIMEKTTRTFYLHVKIDARV